MPRVVSLRVLAETAFVPVDAGLLSETLCVEEERVVGRDNTVAYARLKLQLPESRTRAHYVKARVKVREYPDGTLSVRPCPRQVNKLSAPGTATTTGVSATRAAGNSCCGSYGI